MNYYVKKLLLTDKVVDEVMRYLQGFCGVCLVLWSVMCPFVLIILVLGRFCFLEVEPKL